MKDRIHALRNDEGQAVVELALAIPLLLLVLFAIIQFGEAINYYNDETNLANIAARYATVSSSGASCTGSNKVVTTAPIDQLVKCEGTQDSSALSSVSTCVADPNAASSPVATVPVGDPVEVKLSVPFNLTANLPILGSFLPASITISSSATLRNETAITTATSSFTPTIAKACP